MVVKRKKSIQRGIALHILEDFYQRLFYLSVLTQMREIVPMTLWLGNNLPTNVNVWKGPAHGCDSGSSNGENINV